MPSKATETSGLIQYFDDLVEELRARIADALVGDVEAIHDARVATRRLTALVSLFEPRLSKGLRSRFRGGLKRIRRTFGPVRDLDVMIEHVSALPPSHSLAAGFLLDNLQRQRSDAVRRIGELDAARLLGQLGNWWGLREQLKGPAAKSLLHHALAAHLDQFCHHADLQSGATVTTVGESSGELNPHELRIAGKVLRYTVEIAIADGADIPGRVVKTFKTMQDKLGIWHDLAILSDTIMETCVEEEIALKNTILLQHCLKLAQATARRSEGRLEAFRKLWRSEGASLQQEIRNVIVVEPENLPGDENASDNPPPMEPSETGDNEAD